MTETRTQPAPSCMDEFDPHSQTVEQALANIQALCRPVTGSERVLLRDALNRVLARDVLAALDVPPERNAAMDGYAFAGSDLGTGGEPRFRVVGQSLAGHPYPGTVRSGECVRIMTGAVVPEGADTVVMQERVSVEGDQVTLLADTQAGDNVRLPGQDVKRGDVVLAAGRRVNAADLGLLASQGIAEVDVRRRPVVAYFSTGDELCGIGQPLGPGQIYDSNRHTLYALLRRLDVEIRDLGVIPDQPEAILQAFQEARDMADMVITTGGVSVGDADFVKQTLENLGRIDFWKIAMKPGRPLAFGSLGKAVFFGLPGNPVSTMATFILFVRPALQQLMGMAPAAPLTVRARCENRLRKVPGRTDYQRGILSRDAHGELVVGTTGLQGSHVLSSMSRANAFIVIPREAGDVEAGEMVEVMPLEGHL
ncbi:molybdenum cofactor synthesis domain protein [Thioalkalivibrio sulfidiphilus HL-EbGr7]|uniref:Molybdopterin molybdenumtransferase n=1 Tax=Thioalkalivibrio sulfidiphilus (strain HL-EbGR7) TaxID=396588 RepID=B8GTW8_THISH|nr:gephyrin-like molybdotransferase Glp [Thioalkalivibrio sulfidiphilus]ACL73212.1 molybdenum cofactor synthesis domain protein [Thioalkalivibrio sulfidiphilus HL-EbGr7]